MDDKLKLFKSLTKPDEYKNISEVQEKYPPAEFPYGRNMKHMEHIVPQQRGNEETLPRVHDEAQNSIDSHDKEILQIQKPPLWRKYHSSRKKIVTIIFLGLMIAGIISGAIIITKRINDSFKEFSKLILSVDHPYPGDVHQQEHNISSDSNTAPHEATK